MVRQSNQSDQEESSSRVSKKFLNPLRYPGSKSAFVDDFSEFIKANNLVGRKIVEPYAGSASISLGLLFKGLVSSATLIERDPLIYAFWHCVFFRTADLISAIDDLDISLETWHSFTQYREIDSIDDRDILKMGLAGLFFNRTNFSGVIHAGPIGGQSQESDYSVNCRFNKADLTKRIKTASTLSDRVQIIFGDAIQELKKANDSDNADKFFYVDPPYYKQGRKLYRYHYNLPQHKELADALSVANFQWILSYDNHHVIEHFYADFIKITAGFRYSSRKPKQENELLITNISTWKDYRSVQGEISLLPQGSKATTLVSFTENSKQSTLVELP